MFPTLGTDAFRILAIKILREAAKDSHASAALFIAATAIIETASRHPIGSSDELVHTILSEAIESLESSMHPELMS